MSLSEKSRRLAVGHKIGKYKLKKRIGDGAFGVVYKAFDEIEGQFVALKIHDKTADMSHILHYFRKEIRLLAQVEHPNVLKLKNADVYDGRLFIVSELGKGSLEELPTRKLTVKFATSVLSQILAGLTEVETHNIVHRDIKPGNIILFPRDVVKLGDFGIAKVVEKAAHSIGTDAGTRGYFAPEQIYGQPSFASDIFSLGLVFYEMMTGYLPTWPFQWPFEGNDIFNRRVNARVRRVVRTALEFEEGDRYPDALSMLSDLDAALGSRAGKQSNNSRKRMMPWRKYRELEFSTKFSKLLQLRFKCAKCNGPMSEYMMHCPWCGTDKNGFKGIASFPGVCRRCEHGVKDEWDYCPWCYGKKFTWADVWVTEDKRYIKKCPNKYCGERSVMRWMQYCPWCQTKLRPWIVPQLDGRCRKCHWSVAADYWEFCAWCGETI